MDDKQAQAMLHAPVPLTTVLSTGLPYRPQLASVAHNLLGSYEDVEDVLQEVHLKVWQWARAGGTVEGGVTRFLNFLIVSVRHEAIALLRFRGRWKRTLPTSAGAWGEADYITPERVYAACEELKHICTVLTKREAEAVQLEGQGYTFAEVGKLMGVSTGRAWALVTKARRKLHASSV